MLEFSILGPVEVRRDGRVVALAGARSRVLLVALLIRRDAFVSADRLIEDVWGEHPPASVRKALQMQISRLRRALGDPDGTEVLLTRDGAYRLCAASDSLDAAQFELWLSLARTDVAAGRVEEGRARLERALGLWRGPALADVASEPSLRGEAERLEDLRASAREERIEADLLLGAHGQVIPGLEQLVREHPYRERPRALLMRALYGAGRQADALAAFQDARRTLSEELGLEPSPALRELEAEILRHDPALAVEVPARFRRSAAPAPAASRLTGHPVSLPIEATPLVGRTHELQQVIELLRRDDVRLVTLTGPGGVGKTRLALAATARPSKFDCDVSVVDLTLVRSSESVLPALAQSLGVLESAERSLSETLVESLYHRSALLVLDNFEHVVGAAPDIARLLLGAPGLKVLATSRVPLRLAAEHQYVVPHMPLDDATTLFAQRATAARADFRLDDGNLPLVRALCTRLDGLPLAITLAAARVRHLSLETMLNRLPHALDLLTGGGRDQPFRQQTLRATIDWSYELLTGEERQLFERLSIFAGGCTLESAEEVCGAGLESVSALLDSSLLSTDHADGPEPRLRMLETIREYARERLDRGELIATSTRHADHFLALAERAEPALWGGPEQSLWLQRLKAEHGNLRTALDWLITADAHEVHLRLTGALERFWHLLGNYAEASRQYDIALAHAEDGHELTGKLLWGAAMVAYKKGNFNRARALSERQLEVCEQLDDRLGTARALVGIGGAATAEGDIEAAAAAYSRGLGLCREVGDDWGINVTVSNLGDLALTSGDYEQAAALANEAIRLSRERADNHALAISLGILAFAQLLSDNDDGAVPVLEELVSVSRENEFGEGLCVGLEGLASIAAARRDVDAAARLLGAADELLRTLGGCLEPSDRAMRDRTAGMLDGRISDVRFAEALQQGRKMRLEDSIDEGLQVARSHLRRSEGHVRAVGE
jgi:predicted ATPase/DNA-binding SARP family transcriptional activator